MGIWGLARRHYPLRESNASYRAPEWFGWKDPDTALVFRTILRGVTCGLPHGGVPLQHSYSHFPLGVNYMVNTGASLGLSWSRGPAQIQLSDHQTELGLRWITGFYRLGLQFPHSTTYSGPNEIPYSGSTFHHHPYPGPQFTNGPDQGPWRRNGVTELSFPSPTSDFIRQLPK